MTLKAAELNWRACPTHGIMAASVPSNRCRLCRAETSELWDQHQCADEVGVPVKTWQFYNAVTNNPFRDPANRPPRMLGFHPAAKGVGVWSSQAVRDWIAQRPGPGWHRSAKQNQPEGAAD